MCFLQSLERGKLHFGRRFRCFFRQPNTILMGNHDMDVCRTYVVNLGVELVADPFIFLWKILLRILGAKPFQVSLVWGESSPANCRGLHLKKRDVALAAAARRGRHNFPGPMLKLGVSLKGIASTSFPCGSRAIMTMQHMCMLTTCIPPSAKVGLGLFACRAAHVTKHSLASVHVLHMTSQSAM